MTSGNFLNHFFSHIHLHRSFHVNFILITHNPHRTHENSFTIFFLPFFLGGGQDRVSKRKKNEESFHSHSREIYFCGWGRWKITQSTRWRNETSWSWVESWVITKFVISKWTRNFYLISPSPPPFFVCLIFNICYMSSWKFLRQLIIIICNRMGISSYRDDREH